MSGKWPRFLPVSSFFLAKALFLFEVHINTNECPHSYSRIMTVMRIWTMLFLYIYHKHTQSLSFGLPEIPPFDLIFQSCCQSPHLFLCIQFFPTLPPFLLSSLEARLFKADLFCLWLSPSAFTFPPLLEAICFNCNHVHVWRLQLRQTLRNKDLTRRADTERCTHVVVHRLVRWCHFKGCANVMGLRSHNSINCWIKQESVGKVTS